MSDRRQRTKPPMVSPTLPPFVPPMGQYGEMRVDNRYLFGSQEEACDFRAPEGKYRPSSSPPERPPAFKAIAAGPSSKDLNAPGKPALYGPSNRFSRRTYT